MITLKNAIEQAKANGATKYAINYMDREKKELEYSFIHFFNDNDIEVGYFTYSLREFNTKINIFPDGREWDAEQFNYSLEDWENI